MANDDDALGSLRQRVREANDKTTREAEARQAERDARLAAEGRANGAETREVAAHEAAVNNALVAQEQLAESLEAQLEDAMTAGQAAQVAKITRQLATAQGRIDNLKGQQEQVKAHKDRLSKAPRQATLPAGEDPRLAPYAEYPATMAWIKKNPRFFDDASFKNKALAAHHLAVAEGMRIDSSEYIGFLDRKLGLDRRRDDEDDDRRGERGGRVDEDLRARERTREIDPENDDSDPFSDAAMSVDERAAAARKRGTGTGTAAPQSRGHSLDPDVEEGERRNRRLSRRLSDSDEEAVRISDPDLYNKDPAKAVDTWLRNRDALVREGRITTTRH